MGSQHHLWVMRLVACALLSGCAARVDDTRNLLDTCPNGPDACLEMDLGLANLADQRLLGQELLPGAGVAIDIMRGEFTQPYQLYDIFTLRVRGRLAGGQTQTHDLRFQSGNDLGCTIFGSGDQCVALKDDDRFKRVEPENCAPRRVGRRIDARRVFVNHHGPDGQTGMTRGQLWIRCGLYDPGAVLSKAGPKFRGVAERFMPPRPCPTPDHGDCVCNEGAPWLVPMPSAWRQPADRRAPHSNPGATA